MKLDELLELRLKTQSVQRDMTDKFGINHKYLNWRYFFTFDFLDKYNTWDEQKKDRFRWALAGRAYRDELKLKLKQKTDQLNEIDPYLQTR